MNIKLNCFHYFLLGVLFSIIIFGFFTPLLPGFNLTYRVQSSRAEFITAIATMGAVLVALFRKTLQSVIYKPELDIIDHLNNVQNRSDSIEGWTRLLVKNTGRGIAKTIEVYIERIWDNDGKLREAFLPVPLVWTHNGLSKNLNQEQYSYLDLCKINLTQDNSKPIFNLLAGSGVEDYERIREGETKIQLIFFIDNGASVTYRIILHWAIGELYVKILDIQRFN